MARYYCCMGPPLVEWAQRERLLLSRIPVACMFHFPSYCAVVLAVWYMCVVYVLVLFLAIVFWHIQCPRRFFILEMYKLCGHKLRDSDHRNKQYCSCHAKRAGCKMQKVEPTQASKPVKLTQNEPCGGRQPGPCQSSS